MAFVSSDYFPKASNGLCSLSGAMTEAKFRPMSRAQKNLVTNHRPTLFFSLSKMSDPTLCRGINANGNQCICMQAKDTYVDEHNRTRCTNCDHIESAHPEPKPSVTSFVKGFRHAAKLGSSSSISAPVKASHEDAEAETSAGLRPKKRKSDTSVDPPPKKPNKGAKGKASIMVALFSTVLC
jgi:hypothetical protein